VATTRVVESYVPRMMSSCSRTKRRIGEPRWANEPLCAPRSGIDPRRREWLNISGWGIIPEQFLGTTVKSAFLLAAETGVYDTDVRTVQAPALETASFQKVGIARAVFAGKQDAVRYSSKEFRNAI